MGSIKSMLEYFPGDTVLIPATIVKVNLDAFKKTPIYTVLFNTGKPVLPTFNVRTYEGDEIDRLLKEAEEEKE